MVISHLHLTYSHTLRGSCDVEANNDVATPEQIQKLMAMGGKFIAYAPHFAGPTAVDMAVGQMLSVVEKASVEGGDGGTWVSQFGNKQWL
jgi:hypothetical protein